MGASGIKLEDDRISSLLISLSKLKKFVNGFTKSKEGILSNIFSSLIENDQILKPLVIKFRKKYSKENIGNDYELLKFIFETAHKELSGSDTDLNKIYSSKEEVYNILKKNNSIIQKLFFGIRNNQHTCCICNTETNNFQILVLNKILTLSKNTIETDIKDLIKDFTETGCITKWCDRCKKNTDTITKYKIIDLPEIFIMIFDKLDNSILKFSNSITIRNQIYKKVGFILNKDNNNQETEEWNPFYLEKGKWFVYRIKDNKKVKVEDINGNPFAAFYQRDYTILNNFHKKMPSLFKDKENILELVNEHIVPGIGYENYYVLNKDWYSKLLKIYEKDSKYYDNSYIVDSMEKVSRIKKISLEAKKNIYLNFNERLKNLIANESFKLTFKKGEENTIYPKNFVLIKENILNDLLITINIPNDNFKQYLFGVLIGENNLFIKENIKNNKETIYACYLNKNNFEVYAILNYCRKNYFLNEVKKYIGNRGGLEYYYHKRNINLSKAKQDIIDMEKEKVGDLNNIEELSNIMNMYKYSTNYRNESFTNIKNSMVNTLNNDGNFSQRNYGNSLSNQFNMNNPNYKNILKNINTDRTQSINSLNYPGGN